MGFTEKLTPREALIGELLSDRIPEKDSKLFRQSFGDVMDSTLGEDPAVVVPEWVGHGWDAFRSRCLLWQLRLLGITEVVVSYGGGGDSGQTDSIEFTPSIDAGTIPVSTPFGEKLPRGYRDTVEPVNLESLVDEVAWDFIEKVAGSGWENNEGGNGSVTFDVTRGLAGVAHTNNYDECSSADLESVELPAEIAQLARETFARHPGAKGMSLSHSWWDNDEPTVEFADEDTAPPSEDIQPLIKALFKLAKDAYLEHATFEDAKENYDTLELSFESESAVTLHAEWTETLEDDSNHGAFSMETHESTDWPEEE